MKITDVLKQDKLLLSFEVFPPKTDTAFDSVKAATEEMARAAAPAAIRWRSRRISKNATGCRLWRT